MAGKEKKEFEQVLENKVIDKRSLILHNDDVHSFDYVIEALMEVCEHDVLQAEQCTFLVHYQGKCDVKRGALKKLKPMKDALSERNLSATIK